MKASATGRDSAARVLSRAEHPVSRSKISKNALKVLYRLKDAGFQAFLVGGAVRDLVLGLEPKDFDIATDAHPDDVDALFRNARLIGRRFRLAHVRFGREIIEVATFRAAPVDAQIDDVEHDVEGRIVRDNVYGTIDDDVWRRDFTANALYYNIADYSVWDYVDGYADVQARRLRLIGNPQTRLREDPVRALRAVRFAAKLDFSIDADVAKAIGPTRELLANVPPARLFEEFLKLFQAGHSVKTFELLERYNLFEMLFPDTAEALAGDNGERFRDFIYSALANTDRRINEGLSTTPMFLLGVFLWEPIRQLAGRLAADEGLSEAQALGAAAGELALRQQSRIAVPRRFSAPMREMLAMQPRFDRIRGRRAMGLLEHRRFRAAYDFYVLRAEAGNADAERAEFWTRVQELNQAEREKAFEVRPGKQGGRRSKPRRRRRRRKSKTS